VLVILVDKPVHNHLPLFLSDIHMMCIVCGRDGKCLAVSTPVLEPVDDPTVANFKIKRGEYI
jgi:hypothetical protein